MQLQLRLALLATLALAACDNKANTTDSPRQPAASAPADAAAAAPGPDGADAEQVAPPKTGPEKPVGSGESAVDLSKATPIVFGEPLTVTRETPAATEDGALIIICEGVGYAHLENDGNLADAELTVHLDGSVQKLRLFSEGPNDPEATKTVGPYTITLEGVEAYNSGSAFLVVTRSAE